MRTRADAHAEGLKPVRYDTGGVVNQNMLQRAAGGCSRSARRAFATFVSADERTFADDLHFTIGRHEMVGPRA
jgi:hypothetical protein